MTQASSPDRRIWIDGRLVPWDDARVHVLSHSLQRGSLVFDYTSVHETPRGQAIFRLDDHLQRFLRSAAIVGLPLAWDFAGLRAASLEAARVNPGANAFKICAYLPAVEVDVVPMDIRTPHRQVLERALELTTRKDQETDRERVEALLDAYRSGGLGTIGVERVRQALELGQVDELIITAQAAAFETAAPSRAGDGDAADRSPAERIADELVAKARQTGARLCFIEDPALLQPHGGVGAMLRFTI